MTEQQQQHDIEFTLNPSNPSKRPEQLLRLLESALQREFPDAAKLVKLSRSPDGRIVSLRNLNRLEVNVAQKLAHRARVVFNDFMINPWY